MVEEGVSQTMDSYHLYGLAVDLVPYIDGHPNWDEAACLIVGEAAKEVIQAHGLALEWGYELWGWDMPHFQLTGYKGAYDVREIT